MSRPVDAGVWQLSLRHKTCRDLRKGFRGVGTAETRLGSRGQLSENSSSRHGTPGTYQRISPSRSFSACSRVVSTRRTTTAHKHHPFTIPLLPPPNNNPIHNTNTPAPWSQLALPNASTDQPLYAHRDSINIQSTAPSQLFRKLRHRCTASPAVPPSACDLQHPALLFPSRAAFALARASPTAAHWDMYRRTPTTQTTLLG